MAKPHFLFKAQSAFYSLKPLRLFLTIICSSVCKLNSGGTMQIGIPREIKSGEHRVSLTPAAVADTVAAGHQVFVTHDAGLAIGFTDELYRRAGAQIMPTNEDVFASATLIVKVKELQAEEFALLQFRHRLFSYLHLAAEPLLTNALIDSGACCIAFETIQDSRGRLPLLAPMSEVAGRLAVQAGAHHLSMAQGGRGVLLGGVPGVEPAQVLVLGGGVVGAQAARIAVGMGAQVRVMDKSLPRLRELDDLYRGRLITEFATQTRIEALSQHADMVVGAVLVVGASAPKLLSRAHLASMQPGSVLVDVAIDQGGCFESSRPTTHEHPTYTEQGVIHYCVTNIPSAVARTASFALSNAILPYVLQLASLDDQSMLGHPVNCATERWGCPWGLPGGSSGGNAYLSVWLCHWRSLIYTHAKTLLTSTPSGTEPACICRE
jgi:alanine dehydrogenase